MAHPLMPKATAVWLVENTALTFEQIAEYCGLHMLEVQAIADGEVAVGIRGLDPVANGQLEQSEIDRCAGNPKARLKMAKARVPEAEQRPKGARYTPVSKRHDRPDGIAWLIKNYPEMTDAQVSKLLGTTKTTINAVRDKTHWNSPNIKPRNPVHLGLCSVDALEKTIAVARARAGTTFGPRAEAGASMDDDKMGAGIPEDMTPTEAFAEPEMTEPEMAEPEQAEPETAETETAEPEMAEPEQAEPETAEPETVADNDPDTDQAPDEDSGKA